uniref:Regulator of G-protein signaling 7 n=1 Tax=Plectus sambesii TaxID=2011161 RepID=A0A914W1A0_9BILA
MEALVQKMLDEQSGVPIKTVKSFLSKVPSVFTGQDLVAWIMKNEILQINDLADALHLAHLVASHGYLFQIDDHVLTVKNDGTFYRFQTPYFWPSNCWEPENTDYAVYLCKRTMQNKAHLELEDFEAENLAKLQKMFSRKWEFVFMQAEAQYNEFIDTNATSPVNIDCKVMDITEENLKNPNRWSFDEAADHIYCLVKNDSYQRFLRSDIFRDLLSQSKKKGPVKAGASVGIRFPNLGFGQGMQRREPQAQVSFSTPIS